ncbi:MAG: energy transducer TonB [Chitinophagaceae bacterium]|nr:MAG: energy transducer TonB [Chitinophagaceae bacterium]
MNFNSLKGGFRKVVPALALSLLIAACNNDDAGNTSTSGDNGTGTDTVNMGSGTAQTGNTVTPPADSSARAKRKGRVSASMAADDMNSKIEMDKQGYYGRTEIAPAFTGGQSGLEDYINTNLQYPQQAIDNDVEGTVRVQFAIDEKGNVSNVTTLGEKLGYGLEEEALKVVKNMPKWSAGTVKGKGVKTWRTLPVIYKLEM